MKKALFTLLLLAGICTLSASAQVDTIAKDIEPLMEEEIMPEFPGGTDSLLRYVATHTQYPRYMLRKEIEGTLRVNFVLLETGKIDPYSLEITKSVCYQYNRKGEKVYLDNCKLFEEEAKRVVRALPQWKPGWRNGKAVKVKYQLPFRFQFSD